MRFALLLGALTAPLFALAAPNIRYGTELAPQYRHLNQSGFVGHNEILEGFGRVDAHVEWPLGNWALEAKPEVRALKSRGVNNPAPEAASVKTSNRVLNTRRTIWNSEDAEAYFDFDRLNVRYTFSGGEAFAGRKPISLGVLRFFPVWNKLTLPLIFQPGPEWIENPDVLGASIQHGRISYRAFWSRGNEPKEDDLALFEGRFFGDGAEFQALAGTWWEHTSLGLAGAFDAFGSTLRAEGLWIGPYRDEKSQTQLGLGVERALSSKWTLISEALYQSAGLSETQNVVALPNRFMSLSGKFYLLPYVTYQLHAHWILQGGFLVNLDNETSYVGLGGFDYSVSDQTSLTLKIKWPFGSERGEFGEKRIDDPIGRSQGMPTTAILHLQSTF